MDVFKEETVSKRLTPSSNNFKTLPQPYGKLIIASRFYFVENGLLHIYPKRHFSLSHNKRYAVLALSDQDIVVH